MKTDTPISASPPSVKARRRTFRAAMARGEARWRAEASTPLSELVRPLLTAAALLLEPSAPSHIDSVGSVAETIARAAGWSPEEAAELRIHGALHDVGKLTVSRAILMKPGPLTARERRVVERHPSIGQQLLSGSSIPVLQRAARVAGEHHEWWDGRGYPHGIAGEEIHACSRVIAIADVFDALTSPRPYRAALPFDSALRIMTAGRGSQFDPVLFDAFERAVCSPASEWAA